LISTSITQIENDLKEHLETEKTDYLKRYYENAQKEYAYIGKELSELKNSLFEAKRDDRLGNKEFFTTNASVEYEVIEIGLKESIEGLMIIPRADELRVNLEGISNFIQNGQRYFPFEIRIEGFVFILDDDGSIYIQTENYPKGLVEEAKKYIIDLAEQIYMA